MEKQKKHREGHYETLLRRLLEYDGWLVVKTDAGVASRWVGQAVRSDVPPGFPDLIAVRPNRAVFLEVKTPSGRVGPLQRRFHSLLENMGFEVYVVWGDDFGELYEHKVLSERVLQIHKSPSLSRVREAKRTAVAQ